jgi:hypothetical protein
VLVELAAKTRSSAEDFYAPLYFGTVRLLEGRSDDEIERMIEFLEQGTAMVEAELAKLEREAREG